MVPKTIDRMSAPFFSSEFCSGALWPLLSSSFQENIHLKNHLVPSLYPHKYLHMESNTVLFLQLVLLCNLILGSCKLDPINSLNNSFK